MKLKLRVVLKKKSNLLQVLIVKNENLNIWTSMIID
jgi:hypothetical protein